MVPESTKRHLLAAEAVRAALLELKAAGGEKRYIYCRFGYSIACRLVAAGLATLDDGPTQMAMVRITAKGRLESMDG